jgi:tetrahydromethanopterin S-methyltransferase subunit B
VRRHSEVRVVAESVERPLTPARPNYKEVSMSASVVVAIVFGVVLGVMLMMVMAYAMWATMRAEDGD